MINLQTAIISVFKSSSGQFRQNEDMNDVYMYIYYNHNLQLYNMYLYIYIYIYNICITNVTNIYTYVLITNVTNIHICTYT